MVRACLLGLLLLGMFVGASTAQEPRAELTRDELFAFSRTIADDQGFPVRVRAVVYADPRTCGDVEGCVNRRLFIVVVGDGEYPLFKVYDVGEASAWEHVRWVDRPTSYHDDERDRIVTEFRRTLPCRASNCSGPVVERMRIAVSLYAIETTVIE